MSGSDAAFMLFLVATAIVVGLLTHLTLFLYGVTADPPPLSLSFTVVALLAFALIVRERRAPSQGKGTDR